MLLGYRSASAERAGNAIVRSKCVRSGMVSTISRSAIL